MVLKVLGSSSKGNCYILEASDGVLIIEAGIPAIDVKKALHFKINNVLGCIISHQHRDHSKFLKDIISSGIKVLALEDVFVSHNISNHSFCKTIEPMHGYKIGSFKIFAIPVSHDVPCLGFIVEHQEMGKMLFITDTMMLEYVMPKLDHIMIEVNYCDKILQDYESKLHLVERFDKAKAKVSEIVTLTQDVDSDAAKRMEKICRLSQELMKEL